MNRTFNTSVINSPVNEHRFICSHFKVDFEDASSLVIELVSEEYDQKPIAYGEGCDASTSHGEWLASFYPLGEDTPYMTVGLGSSVLENPTFVNNTYKRTRLGINVVELEGSNDITAERTLLNKLFDQLLIAPGAQHAAHVVIKDRVAMAQWMLEKGLIARRGELKISYKHNNDEYSRIWKTDGREIEIKQTLISTDYGLSLRQSRLIKAEQHIELTSDEVTAGRIPPFVNLMGQPQNMEYRYGDKLITNQHLVQHVAAFDRAGFSSTFINLFIEESEALAEKQPQQPMMGGMNPPMFGAGNAPFNQMQFGGSLMPTGHPATDAVNGMPHMDPASTAQQMHFQPQLNQGYPIGGHRYDPRDGRQY